MSSATSKISWRFPLSFSKKGCLPSHVAWWLVMSQDIFLMIERWHIGVISGMLSAQAYQLPSFFSSWMLCQSSQNSTFTVNNGKAFSIKNPGSDGQFFKEIEKTTFGYHQFIAFFGVHFVKYRLKCCRVHFVTCCKVLLYQKSYWQFDRGDSREHK